MKTMASELMGDLILILHTAATPDNATWKEYVSICTRAGTIANKDYSRVRTLVFSDGGAPTATQRAEVIEVTNGFTGVKEAKVAVVTNSAVARGVITVGSWFGLMMTAFPPEKADEACALLGLSREQISRIAQAVDRLGPTLVGGAPKSAGFIGAAGKRR